MLLHLLSVISPRLNLVAGAYYAHSKTVPSALWLLLLLGRLLLAYTLICQLRTVFVGQVQLVLVYVLRRTSVFIGNAGVFTGKLPRLLIQGYILLKWLHSR